MILTPSLSVCRSLSLSLHTQTHTYKQTNTHTHIHKQREREREREREEQTQHREMVPVAQMEVDTERCTKTMHTFKVNDASLSHQRNLHAT